MQGAGNDFVVLDATRAPFALTREQLRRLADRHFGVGCDQVLVVQRPQGAGADFRYRIFNADGGEVEQCGNGARCFVKFVHAKGLTVKKEIRVESLGGEMESHKVGMTICALSSMAIGAALMYVFDPKSGSQRRRVAQDYARDHLGQYGKAVSGAVTTGYKAVAEKVGAGYEAVSGAVSNVAAKVGIGGGGEEKSEGGSGQAQSRGGNRKSGNGGADRVGGTSTM